MGASLLAAMTLLLPALWLLVGFTAEWGVFYSDTMLTIHIGNPTLHASLLYVKCLLRVTIKKLSVSSYHLTAAGVTQQFCSSIDNLRLVGTMLGVAERSIQDRSLLNI